MDKLLGIQICINNYFGMLTFFFLPLTIFLLIIDLSLLVADILKGMKTTSPF